MRMKCTYRLLFLLTITFSLLLLLGTTGNVFTIFTLFSCHSFPPRYSLLNSTPAHPISSPAPSKDPQKLVLPWKSVKSEAVVSSPSTQHLRHHVISRMVLAVVCCGDRVNETRTMLKSAAALSRTALTMVVFTEEALKPAFREMHATWPPEVRRRITLDLHSITFPPGQDAAAWRKLFKPCASQRLFMPSLLKEIDALIYVDTDTLFLAPLEELWGHFSAMNSSQMAAMAPEHEDLATGWYNRFAKHPFYGRLGVNSGVMLMNLTRLRGFGWEEYVVPIYRYYRLAITWGDQDIINIIFHFHPDKLYVYGCEYNLRPDHCMYMSVCRTAETHGIFVLHGNRGTFHNAKQPAFRAVYRAWEQFQLGQDLRQDLYYPMQRFLLATTNTTCGKMHAAFLKMLSSSVRLR
ncbi:glucoside xylosyltransferase 2-like [Eriocheir sinensis]|uniref:glucoside xylosyltransferase 2-like n=1 Tax=Eriocheir sinensis TaxID=95602 RepID=UPI0021C6A9FA|nr:glucoside xylosyltransferase 2-like [Eriocheir sinensis]